MTNPLSTMHTAFVSLLAAKDLHEVGMLDDLGYILRVNEILKEYKNMWESPTVNFATNEMLQSDGEWYGVDELLMPTGLKDKNGMPIYEGDIVKNKHGATFYAFWQKDEARWRLLGSYADDVCGNTGVMFNARNIEGSEVIGNIYSNPELLK